MMEEKKDVPSSNNQPAAAPPGAGIVLEDQRVSSRRSRKDQEGRDYLCGCGKRYLSYPALYTHIKTKHDGKQPEGTLKTGTNPIAKRTKVKLQEDILKLVVAYFSDFELNTLSQLGQAGKGTVSVNSRIKKDNVPKEVYEQYLHIIKQHDVKLTEQSSLQYALVVFLINVGELTNDKVYQQFLIFAKMARTCFSEHGEEIHRAIFSKKDQGPFHLKQFHNNQVKYFPIIVDFFIRFYVEQHEIKEIKDANLSMMEVITFDFCKWLSHMKLTHIKTKMNKEVEIDFKPPVVVKAKSTPGKVESQKENEDKDDKEGGSDEISQEAEDIEEDPEAEDKPEASKENEQQ